MACRFYASVAIHKSFIISCLLLWSADGRQRIEQIHLSQKISAVMALSRLRVFDEHAYTTLAEVGPLKSSDQLNSVCSIGL